MTEDEQTKFTTPSVLHRTSPYLSREMQAVRQNLPLSQGQSISARIRHRTSLPSVMTLQTHSTNSVKSSKKRGLNLKLLDNVVEALGQGHKLDAKYRNHALHGNWEGFRECHIQPDWLLIYLVENDVLTLTLVEPGTHADIFDE